MQNTGSNREVHIYHASAGSGKTTMLLNCVEEHVRRGIPLSRIAFVTFSRKAAQVAQERVCRRFNAAMEQAVHFSTIHAMCFRALGCKKKDMMGREEYGMFGRKSGFPVSAGSAERACVDYGKLTRVELQADEMLALQQLQETNTHLAKWVYNRRVQDGREFVRFCTEYAKYKTTLGKRDFTDLLKDYLRTEGMEEDVDVACIDEAQDCSPLQWQVLLKAFRKAKVIYIAGDDKQELFAYAGADSRILTGMRGQSHVMPISYRVPSNILSFVQSNIVDTIEDVVKTQVEANREGGEIRHIVRLEDVDWRKDKTYMLLGRTRAQLAIYVEFCQQHAIPYIYMGCLWRTQAERKKWVEGKTEDELCAKFANKGMLWQEAKVVIDTVHAVKGDEADVVVMQSDMARLPRRMYESGGMVRNWERKVLYVGCTRAKETLYILEPKTKYYYRELGV